jgi:hypothetical protein
LKQDFLKQISENKGLRNFPAAGASGMNLERH